MRASSATRPATSSCACAGRGTSKVEPACTTMRSGMRLTSRRSASGMPTSCAASDVFTVRGATHAVHVAIGPRCTAISARKRLALSYGSSTTGVPAARITGLFICGFSALKSASGRSASFAASATSMSRSIATPTKCGWLPKGGKLTEKACGRATRFFTACSFGT